MGKNEQGFTIVELLVGMAILVLIMSGIFGILVSSVKSYQYHIDQTQNIQSSRQIFNEITIGIKNATAITQTTPTLNYKINDDVYIISVNAVTNAVEIKKNTDPARSFGVGHVDKILFDSVNSGTKKQITINLHFKSNSAQPVTIAVTTLNDIL